MASRYALLGLLLDSIPPLAKEMKKGQMEMLPRCYLWRKGDFCDSQSTVINNMAFRKIAVLTVENGDCLSTLSSQYCQFIAACCWEAFSRPWKLSVAKLPREFHSKNRICTCVIFPSYVTDQCPETSHSEKHRLKFLPGRLCCYSCCHFHLLTLKGPRRENPSLLFKRFGVL